MSEFTIANDLDGELVVALHSEIVDAIDNFFERKGIAPHARAIIASLLMDVCDITQGAPDEPRADIAEEAVHFIMTNSGTDAKKVFEAHRERTAHHSLALAEPKGRA